MLDQAGRYYGAPFNGSKGITQGNPLSATIFNSVAYTVILHWETVVVGEEAGPDGFVRSVQTLVMIFYVDDGFLASPRLARLQEALGVLTGLFYRVV